jgi:hypothetical protein
VLAVHDTSGAIAVLEAMVKRNEKNTEAHYRAGLLYMSRHVPGKWPPAKASRTLGRRPRSSLAFAHEGDLGPSRNRASDRDC